MNNALARQLIAKCPLCQTGYQDKGVQLLGERGAMRVFHCTCYSCGHAMLAMVLETPGAISSMGLVTDLEVGDAIRLKDQTILSSDEVLQAYRSLKINSREFCNELMRGNFSELTK